MKDLAIDEWLQTLAARQPTPGGGSVAALAAASAAALIGMVSIYTTGPKWADRESEMMDLHGQAEEWRRRALELAHEDEVAFAAVGAAYGLPKGTVDEVEARKEAIQGALIGAALPPVRTAELAGEIVDAAEQLVESANPNVLSDVGVASAMAEAAIASAILNIAINQSQVHDTGERQRLLASLATAESNARRAREITRRVLVGLFVTEILSGKELAASIRSEVAGAAEELRNDGTVPTVVIVVATEDDGTLSYVRSLVRAAASTGIEAEVVSLPAAASEEEVVAELTKAGEDLRVHGILLQTPLPEGMSAAAVALHIPAAKDVDGANPLSLGRLTAGLPSFAPATAVAVMELLAHHSIALAGRSVALVGRSTVVGKPLAQLMLAANATVTICHSKTPDLPAVTRAADVVIAAAGSPHLIGADHVSERSVLIDVGTNVGAGGNLLGDVDGVVIDGVAAARSPVPGGVGPVTTAVLLRHVVEAAQAGGTPG